MNFGLMVTLVWWQWLLMVFGAGFCWALGQRLAQGLLAKL